MASLRQPVWVSSVLPVGLGNPCCFTVRQRVLLPLSHSDIGEAEVSHGAEVQRSSMKLCESGSERRPLGQSRGAKVFWTWWGRGDLFARLAG